MRGSPSTKPTPGTTSPSRDGPSSRRQRCCALRQSRKTISAVRRDRQPLVLVVRKADRGERALDRIGNGRIDMTRSALEGFGLPTLYAPSAPQPGWSHHTSGRRSSGTCARSTASAMTSPSRTTRDRRGHRRRSAVRRLLTVAGINVTVAAGLVAAIGDIRRLSSPQKLVSYFGLNPRVAVRAWLRPAWPDQQDRPVTRSAPAWLRCLRRSIPPAWQRSPAPC